MKVLLRLLAVLFILFVIIPSMMGIISNILRSEAVKYSYFKRNLKRINLAVISYAEEHNGIMPSASSWADLIKNNNQLLLKADFVTPMSHPNFGVYYNNALENKLLTSLKDDTVILFTNRGEWNSNGDIRFLHEKAVNLNHLYIITLNGEIYRYHPKKDTCKKLSSAEWINSESL